MKGISEKQFLAQVVDLARLCGFTHIYHTYDSRRSVPGFPDLVLLKPGRCLFIEVKREGKRLTPTQEDWARALREAGAEVWWFMPSEWELLKRVLDPEGRIE